MTAQALIVAGDDVDKFRRRLAWKLRWWILALPAGAGLATARACLRLWVGFSPERSGVRSAGNGAAMRSAIIGARFSNDAAQRRMFVSASSRLTHDDERAETAALAVAEAVAWIIAGNPSRHFAERLPEFGGDAAWLKVAKQMNEALDANQSVSQFAAGLGQSSRVTGYAYHSVPVAIYSWLRHSGDFEQTIEDVVRCGGDTDTMAAIAGALAGCECAERGIPSDWLAAVRDWPRSIQFTKEVAGCFAEGRIIKSVGHFWPGVLPRNLFFLVVVLLHGFRRMFPPYGKSQPKH